MRHSAGLWIAIFLIGSFSQLRLEAKDSCVECHAVLEGSLLISTQTFSADVHQRRGFSCADCHGGDSSLDDPDAAMSSKRGFVGKIKRTEVPVLCARCHSDASLIHKFRPQQRVDQYAQYQTSVHGERIAAGDASAANCVDCHGVHDIREVKDARSPVHPLRLPETCARCHADAAHMVKYQLPITQFEDYRKSVHWEALAQRADLSAPSCASCHGNHGATPPQVESVAAVCGTCHALIEDLYSKSPHQPVFAGMGLGGCVVCHGNHAVSRPTDTLLAGPSSICSHCHDASSSGGKVSAAMARGIANLQASLQRSDDLLGVAKRSGMEVAEALLRLQEGREALIKARVAIHNFQVAFVNKPVSEGLAIATETYYAGEEAMRERRFRRLGLAFSLLTIAATIAGLWLAVQSIESRSQDTKPGSS